MKLLADATRLQLVWALLHGEHAVGELASHIGAQPANVSQHLAKLRLARLVKVRREGNRVLYLIENEHVRRLLEEALFHTNHVRHDLPDHTKRAAAKTGEAKPA